MNAAVNIPTRDEAYALLAETGSLPNIIEHSELVMRVTEAICANLKAHQTVSTELACMGALLHDVTKSESIRNHQRHDHSGYEFMMRKGFPEIAEIIGRHVYIGDYHSDAPLSEVEIVHYADKRVKHSIIVSLDERIADLIDRYGHTEEIRNDIACRIGFLKDLERKIERAMSVPMAEALAHIA
jgi:uncharacterized protein